MLILNRQEVEELLDLDRLIEALAPAMVALSAGQVSMPQRTVTRVLDEGGLLGVMPAYVPSSSVLSTKLVSVYPSNPRSGLPAHQALIVLFDAASGTPQVVMDGTTITAMRTAAGSALATRLLARPDAGILLIVGAGVQAWSHARAIPHARPIEEIRVVARDEDKGRRFAAQVAADLGIPATFFPSFAAAAPGAAIICAATDAAEPVVLGEALEPGTHLNSVGLNATGRELDAAAVLKSLVIVESREAALAPGPGGANDLIMPIREGLMTADSIHAEVGELLSGARQGRTSAEQITLYKSVGVAVQDAVAAQLVLLAAREQGVGKEIEL